MKRRFILGAIRQVNGLGGNPLLTLQQRQELAEDLSEVSAIHFFDHQHVFVPGVGVRGNNDLKKYTIG